MKAQNGEPFAVVLHATVNKVVALDDSGLQRFEECACISLWVTNARFKRINFIQVLDRFINLALKILGIGFGPQVLTRNANRRWAGDGDVSRVRCGGAPEASNQ